MKHRKIELMGPPIAVRVCANFARHRALHFSCHVLSSELMGRTISAADTGIQVIVSMAAIERLYHR
jgi:hypothetical protein